MFKNHITSTLLFVFIVLDENDRDIKPTRHCKHQITVAVDPCPVGLSIHTKYVGESFQDFEADFPQKVSLKILN